MEILKEIKDKEWPGDLSALKFREASRAIIFDEHNLIPMLFVSKHNFHKLPGGGINPGENKIEALIREIREETGCEIEVIGEVGQIVEHRSKWNLKQVSYCYLGKIILKGKLDFTNEEIKDGFQLVWLSLDEAISRIEKEKPEHYEGSFIVQRDLIFLQKAKEILNKNL